MTGFQPVLENRLKLLSYYFKLLLSDISFHHRKCILMNADFLNQIQGHQVNYRIDIIRQQQSSLSSLFYEGRETLEEHRKLRMFLPNVLLKKHLLLINKLKKLLSSLQTPTLPTNGIGLSRVCRVEVRDLIKYFWISKTNCPKDGMMALLTGSLLNGSIWRVALELN